LKFRVTKKSTTSALGNKMTNQMNIDWSGLSIRPRATVILTSDRPEKMAMMVRGFLTAGIFSVIIQG